MLGAVTKRTQGCTIGGCTFAFAQTRVHQQAPLREFGHEMFEFAQCGIAHALPLLNLQCRAARARPL